MDSTKNVGWRPSERAIENQYGPWLKVQPSRQHGGGRWEPGGIPAAQPPQTDDEAVRNRQWSKKTKSGEGQPSRSVNSGEIDRESLNEDLGLAGETDGNAQRQCSINFASNPIDCREGAESPPSKTATMQSPEEGCARFGASIPLSQMRPPNTQIRIVFSTINFGATTVTEKGCSENLGDNQGLLSSVQQRILQTEALSSGENQGETAEEMEGVMEVEISVISPSSPRLLKGEDSQGIMGLLPKIPSTSHVSPAVGVDQIALNGHVVLSYDYSVQK